MTTAFSAAASLPVTLAVGLGAWLLARRGVFATPSSAEAVPDWLEGFEDESFLGPSFAETCLWPHATLSAPLTEAALKLSFFESISGRWLAPAIGFVVAHVWRLRALR